MKHSSILHFFSISVTKSINSDFVIKRIIIDNGCNYDNGRYGPKVKRNLRLKEIGALNISTGHDIHATEAASAVAIKNAFKIVIKIKIAFSNMI